MSNTSQTSQWTVAIVEDKEVIRTQLKEFLENETFSFGTVRAEAISGFDQALLLLQQNRIDLIILDLFEGEPREGKERGREVLEQWKKTCFAPVIFYTALDSSIKNLHGPFIKVLAKRADGFATIKSEIENLFSNKIPHIQRIVRDEFELVLRDYMWGFADGHWAEFQNAFGSSSLVRDFMKVLLHRLGSHFLSSGYDSLRRSVGGGAASQDQADDITEIAHPIEYYIVPPLAKDIRSGDLRKVTITEKEVTVIVQWPSCDLVNRKGTYKTDTVLCLEVMPLNDFDEYKSIDQPSASDKPLKNLISNRRSSGDSQQDRYHFLPPALNISAGVIDFQKIHILSRLSLQSANCIATLASPFAESVTSRFGRYLGRLGTPDLESSHIVELLKKLKNNPSKSG